MNDILKWKKYSFWLKELSKMKLFFFFTYHVSRSNSRSFGILSERIRLDAKNWILKTFCIIIHEWYYLLQERFHSWLKELSELKLIFSFFLTTLSEVIRRSSDEKGSVWMQNWILKTFCIITHEWYSLVEKKISFLIEGAFRNETFFFFPYRAFSEVTRGSLGSSEKGSVWLQNWILKTFLYHHIWMI